MHDGKEKNNYLLNNNCNLTYMYLERFWSCFINNIFRHIFCVKPSNILFQKLPNQKTKQAQFYLGFLFSNTGFNLMFLLSADLFAQEVDTSLVPVMYTWSFFLTSNRYSSHTHHTCTHTLSHLSKHIKSCRNMA